MSRNRPAFRPPSPLPLSAPRSPTLGPNSLDSRPLSPRPPLTGNPFSSRSGRYGVSRNILSRFSIPLLLVTSFTLGILWSRWNERLGAAGVRILREVEERYRFIGSGGGAGVLVAGEGNGRDIPFHIGSGADGGIGDGLVDYPDSAPLGELAGGKQGISGSLGDGSKGWKGKSKNNKGKDFHPGVGGQGGAGIGNSEHHLLAALPIQDSFFEKDGLVYAHPLDNNPGGTDYQIHPIHHLVREARISWNDKLKRQSRDLKEAAREYEKRYGRKPFKGFDQWYNFAMRSNSRLIDEYDQISSDIHPFLALPPSVLKKRSETLQHDPENYYHQGSYTIHVRGGKVSGVEGPWSKGNNRLQDQVRLMDGFVGMLPDLDITVWQHDTPVVHTSGDRKQQYIDAARHYQIVPSSIYEDPHDTASLVGWEAFCTPRSNLRNAWAGAGAGDEPGVGAGLGGKSFVKDHFKAMEICRHPGNLVLHSQTSNYGIGPRAVLHWPLFSHSKTTMYSDILITPQEQYEHEPGADPAWEDKDMNKMLWRGSTTGSRYDRATYWRPSPRARLNILANKAEGDRTVLYSPYSSSSSYAGALSTFNSSVSKLNERFFDVAFTGEPVQCQADDGTCDAVKALYRFDEKMDLRTANRFKYIMDLDGNGWSGRFHRLMTTKSLIFKTTIFTEWYTQRIQPWLHYIPVKVDYSDLYDIMAFFLGDEDGVGANDALARQLGEAGRKWAMEYWRYEDMEVYMFRVYLEYARLFYRTEGDEWEFTDY